MPISYLWIWTLESYCLRSAFDLLTKGWTNYSTKLPTRYKFGQTFCYGHYVSFAGSHRNGLLHWPAEMFLLFIVFWHCFPLVPTFLISRVAGGWRASMAAFPPRLASESCGAPANSITSRNLFITKQQQSTQSATRFAGFITDSKMESFFHKKLILFT